MIVLEYDFLKWWIAGIFAGLMLSYFVLVYVPVYFIYNKLESKCQP